MSKLYSKNNKVVSMRRSDNKMYMGIATDCGRAVTIYFRLPHYEIPNIITHFKSWYDEKSTYSNFYFELYDADLNEIKIVSYTEPNTVFVIDCANNRTFEVEMDISDFILEIINCIRDNEEFISILTKATSDPADSKRRKKMEQLESNALRSLIDCVESKIKLDDFYRYEYYEMED